MRLKQRLALLETLWPIPARMMTEGDVGSLCYWSKPTSVDELRAWCGIRSERRYRAETGGVVWRLPADDQEDRLQFEGSELCRLTVLLGDVDGFAAWHQQADQWPSTPSPCDQASFEARLWHAWRNADVMRAHPSTWLFRQTWPEWSPDLTDAERLAFDVLLVRERETRLAPFQSDLPTGDTRDDQDD